MEISIPKIKKSIMFSQKAFLIFQEMERSVHKTCL